MNKIQLIFSGVLIYFFCNLLFLVPVYASETNKTVSNDSVILTIPLENSGLEYQINGDGYSSGPTSFAVKGDIVYLLNGEKNSVLVYENNQKINEFQVIGLQAASDIRVSDNFIYVLDNETKKLASFYLDGKHITTIGLNDYKSILTLDLDNNDLILKTGSSLIKYNEYLKEISCNQNYYKLNKETKQMRSLELPDSKTKITITSNELLGSMNLTYIDKKGYLYITTEEIVDAPVIMVEQTIKKFDSFGEQVGTARVPLELYAVHPFRYTDTTDDGIFALVPRINSIDILKLNITENFVSNLPQMREQFYNNYQPNSASNPGTLRATYLSRQEVENNGYDMHTNSWTLNSTNRESISGVTIPDWLRNVSVPYNASGIPYCWGGFDSLGTSSPGSSWSNFSSAMAYGANAGNVNCSGYYKLGTAGLDCAGYASRCFDFYNRWSTYDFYDDTSLFEDINVSELGNCDIVVHRTQHILLWKGVDYNNSNHIFTYESTTAGLDKCKEYDRYWSSLSGYKCRTYKYFY